MVGKRSATGRVGGTHIPMQVGSAGLGPNRICPKNRGKCLLGNRQAVTRAPVKVSGVARRWWPSSENSRNANRRPTLGVGTDYPVRISNFRQPNSFPNPRHKRRPPLP